MVMFSSIISLAALRRRQCNTNSTTDFPVRLFTFHLRLVYVLLNEGYQLFEELGILLVGREFTTVGIMVLGVVLLELVAVPEKVEDGKVEIGQVYRLLKV